jgi:hypothetical protein
MKGVFWSAVKAKNMTAHTKERHHMTDGCMLVLWVVCAVGCVGRNVTYRLEGSSVRCLESCHVMSGHVRSCHVMSWNISTMDVSVHCVKRRSKRNGREENDQKRDGMCSKL